MEATVDIGLTLPQLGGHVTRDGFRGFCEQAEELGYGSLWVQEHLFYPHHPVSGYSARPIPRSVWLIHSASRGRSFCNSRDSSS